MKNRKMMMVLAITLMAIGFASVSTVLYLNGQTFVVSNTSDFDVYFSKAIENGIENNTLIQDKTHLAFETELSNVNETYVLNYDVTNASKQYDANLIMNCVGGDEYLRVENKFYVGEPLKARETRKGVLTLTVIKSVMEERRVTITCEIRGNAVEREQAGESAIKEEQMNRLMDSSASTLTYLGHSLDRSKVESITLKDTKDIPNEAIESWDVSESQNGSIMAYTLDENNNELLELYIGQNGGVNAYLTTSYLFSGFTNVTAINGLEFLNTADVESMTSMFANCRKITSLDLSSFDTKKVTSMDQMFYHCDELVNLDLTNFDTGNVTNMNGMFATCYLLANADLSHFDMRNVTDMSTMFSSCGNLNTTIVIRGIKCTRYTNMFNNAAKNENAKIIVLYTEDASELVDQMIATKSSNSNVIKDSLPKYQITINDSQNIVSDYNEAYGLTRVTLTSTLENFLITSFRLNGNLIDGYSFIMPNEDVIVTDVKTQKGAIIESEHYPYQKNMDNHIMGEKTFEGATSLTVTLDYQTEHTNFDWLYLYDGEGKEYGKYGGSTRNTETITIPGNYIKAVFRSDGYDNDFYGFKATIIPNYE